MEKNRYHKMSEEKKTRLKKSQKDYYKAKKSQYIIIKQFFKLRYNNKLK